MGEDGEGEKAAKLHKDVCQRGRRQRQRQRQWLSQAERQVEMDTERQRGRESKGREVGVAATATQVCISKKIIIIDAAKEAHIQRGCAEEAREREREGDFKRLED